MARPKLTLYTDVISPFGYLAWHILHNSPVFEDCDITFVPVFQGGIMQMNDNRPPMQIKNKGPYNAFERQYFAQRFNVPFGPRSPTPFPQFTLHTMRSVCALQQLQPHKVDEYMEALFHTLWIDLEEVAKPEVFGKVLGRVLGDEEKAKEVLDRVGGQEAKDALKRNTDEAFASGMFGAPWFVAEDVKGKKQGFWGVSHLGLLIEFLGLNRSKDAGFRALL